MRKHQNRNLQNGFSLVEVMVYIFIFTVISLAIVESIIHLYRVNGYAIAQADEVNSARRALVRWSHDTREMLTAEDGSYPLVQMEDNRLGYYCDTDDDDSVEYVEYILSDTSLIKNTFEPTGDPPSYNFSTPSESETISEYVQNLSYGTSTFAYFDSYGGQIAGGESVLDVRHITMQLIVNIDNSRSPGEFLLHSAVTPRNTRDELWGESYFEDGGSDFSPY